MRKLLLSTPRQLEGLVHIVCKLQQAELLEQLLLTDLAFTRHVVAANAMVSSITEVKTVRVRLTVSLRWLTKCQAEFFHLFDMLKGVWNQPVKGDICSCRKLCRKLQEQTIVPAMLWTCWLQQRTAKPRTTSLVSKCLCEL